MRRPFRVAMLHTRSEVALSMNHHETSQSPDRIQLHLVLPYKDEAATHPRIKAHLERGYRIEQLQRVTDREVLVTLVPTRSST